MMINCNIGCCLGNEGGDRQLGRVPQHVIDSEEDSLRAWHEDSDVVGGYLAFPRWRTCYCVAVILYSIIEYIAIFI